MRVQWLVQGLIPVRLCLAFVKETLENEEHQEQMSERRILLIDLNRFFGGGQVYLLQLASLLENKTRIYAFCINPRVSALLREHGVITVCFPWASNKGKATHFALCAILTLWFRL